MQRKILIKELVARGAKQKNIPIIMYQKISTDIKSFLSMVTSTPQLKAAIKIANYLIASNNAHHQLKSLTPEALHILKEAIIDGLCVSGMIDHLTDEKDIQIIQLRLALINAIQAGILQCIKNSSFNVGEIVTVISQAVSLWKEKKALEELSEESVSDLPPQQAGTSRAGLFNGFNTSLVIQQTFFAHAQLKQSPMAVSTPSSCQTNPYRN